MTKTFSDLSLPSRILLGPGPSMTSPRVLRVMSTPPVGYLDAHMLAVYAEEQTLLQELFGTQNPWTFALSGTGTAGMQAAMTNLLEAGDAVLVAVNGFFGRRLAEIARRLGAEVDVIERPLGAAFPVEAIAAALRRKRYKVLALVHAETSTGVWQPEIGAICEVAHRHGALVVLDTVTSLGGVPVTVDAWGVDIAYSASQKCIGAPSGLAPITVSERARQAIAARKTPVPSLYLDLRLYARYWLEHSYHHTASASLHYALREALREIHEEGLAARYARHRENAALLWDGLEDLGVVPFVAREWRLPPLTTARVPADVNPHAVRQRLLQEYNLEIAAGFGALRDAVWRIGLMGYSSRRENVTLLLAALREVL